MKKCGIGRGMLNSIVLTVRNTKKLVRGQSTPPPPPPPPPLLLAIMLMVVKDKERSCN